MVLGPQEIRSFGVLEGYLDGAFVLSAVREKSVDDLRFERDEDVRVHFAFTVRGRQTLHHHEKKKSKDGKQIHL